MKLKFKVGDIIYYNGREGIPLTYFHSTLVAIILDIKKSIMGRDLKLRTTYTAMILKNKDHLFVLGEICYFNQEVVESNYDCA